ncbi:MAG TPA: thioredoxin family protein [Acetobacteraceae bacterium]|nr:thioredoxin family protein [Acetobacteraceae bacterium]
MQNQPVVTRDEWLTARTALLAREKELTRLRDRLSVERRNLPWVRVTKRYVFDGPDGRETLADLFGGRGQLIVKHFMLGPGWQEGCVGCSFHADHIDGALVHLAQRDVTLVAVARAPLAEIEAFKRRMGWRFKWVSAHGSDFNYDFHVSFTEADAAKGKVYYNYQMRDFASEEMSGISVFYQDAAGDIFHTYSSYARGNEPLLGTYSYLDLVPKGRDERHNLTDWVRHHDRYGDGGFVAPTGRYVASEDTGPCCGSGE